METTTIRIRKQTVALMEEYKIHPRETWDDLINRLLDKVDEVNQNDETI